MGMKRKVISEGKFSNKEQILKAVQRILKGGVPMHVENRLIQEIVFPPSVFEKISAFDRLFELREKLLKIEVRCREDWISKPEFKDFQAEHVALVKSGSRANLVLAVQSNALDFLVIPNSYDLYTVAQYDGSERTRLKTMDILPYKPKGFWEGLLDQLKFWGNNTEPPGITIPTLLARQGLPYNRRGGLWVLDAMLEALFKEDYKSPQVDVNDFIHLTWDLGSYLELKKQLEILIECGILEYKAKRSDEPITKLDELGRKLPLPSYKRRFSGSDNNFPF